MTGIPGVPVYEESDLFGYEQIRAASPRLGEHLAATVATGVYCSHDRE